MTGEIFALNMYKGTYFGRNNLTDLFRDRLVINSKLFLKRDSTVCVENTKSLLNLKRMK